MGIRCATHYSVFGRLFCHNLSGKNVERGDAGEYFNRDFNQTKRRDTTTGTQG